MKQTIARARVILRSTIRHGALERLVLLRGVLRRASFGRYRSSRHAADLDARILDALNSFFSVPYREWLRRYQPATAPSPDDAAAFPPPSVVLYPSGASATRLARCLRGLRRQDRPFAEMIVLVTTPGQRLAAKVASLLAAESRLTIVRRSLDLTASLGDAVLLLKGAPVLRPGGLGVLVSALAERPDAVAAYADEDRIGPVGFSLPFFKPDRSPVLGRQYDYVGNVTLFRRDIFLRAVLPDLRDDVLPGWIGDPTIERDAVIHVPQILHAEPGRRRFSYLSGAAFDRALTETARRRPLPSVCVIIPSKDRASLLRDCIDSIFRVTDYDADKLSVMIVDNGSNEATARRLLRELETDPSITTLSRPGAFNYARLCNEGAAAASAELLIFLNNDIIIRDRDWIAKLAGATAMPSVGVVGCKLLFPSGRVQHAGVILGIHGLAGHIGVDAAEHDGVYFDLANHTREVSAVTGALLAIRSDLFGRAGGYDENLAVAFNDAALCLTCNSLGHQTLYLQSALAFHVESASRGHDDHDPIKRIRLMRECLHVLSTHSGFKRDPFYNLNLSLIDAYELADPPRHLRREARGDEAPRVLMLSSTFQVGHGVAVVIDILARSLRDDACTVFIGAPRTAREFTWPPEQRLDVRDPHAAARLAVDLDADVVIAHTPPFYGVFKVLPMAIAGIAYDYGEPPPDLFPDELERRLVLGDKFISMRYADRLLAISDVVRDENPISGCGVLPLGNTHLARWDEGSAERRRATRAIRGWAGQLVILNVCRFHEGERFYKGIEFYINLRRSLELLHPEVAALTRFVLAGKGDRADSDFVGARGIDVVANPSDAALAGLYHACDLYMNFSLWEGYNLGIGQALALGLPVVASDIPAHRAFGVRVTATLSDALGEVVRAFHESGRAELAGERHPVVWEWAPSGARLRTEIDDVLARVRSPSLSSGGRASLGPVPAR